MAQVLVELDGATAERLNELATAQGKSASAWWEELVRDRIDRGWPPAFLALAGAFFGHLEPSARETIAAAMNEIVRRQGSRAVPID
jgi:predicted transcriptional regulator